MHNTIPPLRGARGVSLYVMKEAMKSKGIVAYKNTPLTPLKGGIIFMLAFA